MTRSNLPAREPARRTWHWPVVMLAAVAWLPVFHASAQSSALATLPIVVSHTPADADGSARVEIRIPDYQADLGITAYQFDLPLPAGVEFVRTVTTGTHSTGGILGANVLNDRTLRIAYAGTAPSTALDAPLLHLDLKINSGQGGELYPKNVILNTTPNRAVRPGSVFPPAVPIAVSTGFTRFPDAVELEIQAPDLAPYDVHSFDMVVQFESTRLRLDSVITRQTQAGEAAMQVAYRVKGDTVRIAAATSASLSGALPLLRFQFTPRVNPLVRAELPVSILNLSFNNTGSDLPGADPTRLIPGRVVLDGDSVGVKEPDANLLFSEYVSGIGSDVALEVFNASPTPAILRQDGFPGWMVLWLDQPNGTRDWANHAAVIPFPDGFRLPAYSTFVIANPDADLSITGAASSLSNRLLAGGGAAVALAFDADADGAYDPAVDALVDVIGDLSGVPGPDLFANTTLVRYGSVTAGATVFDAGEWTSHEGAPVRYLGENGYYASIDGPAGFRLLSLPMSGGGASQVADDTPVQGIVGGPNPEEAPNLLLYGAERRLQPPASLTAPLSDGQGFALYFFNNNLAGSQPLPLTLQAGGPEPAAEVALTLNTAEASEASGASGGAGTSYFTLAGNPFASGFDLSAIASVDGDGIQDHVHMWSAALGTYQVLDRTAGRVVAPWQGFWVEVSTAGVPTSQIRFPLLGRVPTAGAERFMTRRADSDASLSFTLRSDATVDHAIRLNLRADAEHGFDRADASKLTPLNPAYAVLAFHDADGRLKSVESRPSTLDEPLELDMSLITDGVGGAFTLAWDGLDSFPVDWGLSLLDRRTGEVVDLREHATMTIDVPQAAAKSADRSGLQPVLSPVLKPSQAGEASSESSLTRRFALTLDPHAGAAGTSVRPDTDLDELPREVALHAAYPNPFNPATQIAFDLPVASHMTLEVFNLLSRKVATLREGTLPAGRHRVEWDASSLASGVYAYRLNVQGTSITRTLTLLR